MKKIVLAGNPNVGKSAIFSRLTGVHVVSSNYPGTTVSLLQGYLRINDEKYQLIDAPGIYDLTIISEADKIANEIIKDATLIINVIDATNLERNLRLTIQLLKLRKPMIVLLNFWDETKHKGIEINVKKFENIIGVPVIPTVGISGMGIKECVDIIAKKDSKNLISSFDYEDGKEWETIGKIVDSVQKLQHRHHSFADILHHITLHPISGPIFLLFVLYLSFKVIRFVSEGMIGYIFDPFFQKVYAPLLLKIINAIHFSPFVKNILVGELINGKIDFYQSFGVLSTGLYVPIAAVFPYILSFYFILGIMEDSGYLPRVAILLDNFFHKLGLHGWIIIPVLLGIGCNVPGILATRILESKKQRFIAIISISIAVPCAAMQAMIIGLVGKRTSIGIFIIYFTLFLVWIITSKILGYLYKGESPELIIEIPSYRIPHFPSLLKKTYVRIISFFREAVPFVLIGVLIANILYYLNVIQLVGKITSPFLTLILGLPEDSIVPLIIGILRKDIGVGLLEGIGLNIKQLIVACLFLAMSFPCIATFIAILKELGFKYFAIGTVTMFIIATTVAALVNFILSFIPISFLLNT